MLEYEGLVLGSSLDELIAAAAARGWRQNAHPATTADQKVTVFTTPAHPVKRYRLGYERGALVSIEIDYRTPDAARLALVDRFAVGRHLQTMWYLVDDRREVLAAIDDAGATTRALHLVRLRDQREAQAMLRVTVDAPADQQPDQK